MHLLLYCLSLLLTFALTLQLQYWAQREPATWVTPELAGSWVTLYLSCPLLLWGHSRSGCSSLSALAGQTCPCSCLLNCQTPVTALVHGLSWPFLCSFFSPVLKSTPGPKFLGKQTYVPLRGAPLQPAHGEEGPSIQARIKSSLRALQAFSADHTWGSSSTEWPAENVFYLIKQVLLTLLERELVILDAIKEVMVGHLLLGIRSSYRACLF